MTDHIASNQLKLELIRLGLIEALLTALEQRSNDAYFYRSCAKIQGMLDERQEVLNKMTWEKTHEVMSS